jgi:acyl-CoA thioesterase
MIYIAFFVGGFVLLTEEFKEKVRSHIIEQSEAVKNLGIVMDFCGEGRVVLGLPITPCTTNGYRICHGGSYMMLADSAMGAVCFALNKKVVTLEANISYLKSAPIGARLRAVASALHNGSRTLSCICDIFDDDNNLCAQARGTFFVVGHIE